ELNVDSSVKWLQNGAQPTDTARAILKYKGAMIKNHLAGGVRKGAITEEQAEDRFKEWEENKKSSIDAKKEGLSKEQETAKAKALEAEKEKNSKREAEAKAVEDEAKAAETAEKEAEIAKEQEEGVNSAAPEPVIDEDNIEASAENEIDTKTSDEASAKQKVKGTENSEK
ncbi:MAG TPA: hypothetical protein VFI78_05905, partial [Salinimicrobium sp.]|nr:hypothetical protein [Salinimicrobium sp.]